MKNIKNLLGIVLPAAKIGLALVLVTMGLLGTAQILEFIPEESKFRLDARKKVSESLAIQVSILAPKTNLTELKKLVLGVAKRNPDIISSGIRLANGDLIYSAGDHSKLWGGYGSGQSTPTHVIVPLYSGNVKWGSVELLFSPLKRSYFSDIHRHPFIKLLAFVAPAGFLVFFVFMLRIMRKLDPSSVIPERVNAAFDTLAEGVLILDEKEQVVLTNRSLSEKLNMEPLSLIGKKASELHWTKISKQTNQYEFPWLETLSTGKSFMGFQINLDSSDGTRLKFAINCSPIDSNGTTVQGVLVTLDDITQLEERNSELKSLVVNLKESQSQIQKKNRELYTLATRDSLTGCYNRRAFSDLYKEAFDGALNQGLDLVCIMVDIDHFKAVNDNFGHGVGDEVIKLLADILHAHAGDEDIVGRYGGEEFCIILPGKTADEGVAVAEKMRISLKEKSISNFESGPRVTASLGVASILDNPANPSELNKWADEALYEAKESGRNRVVRWTPADVLSDLAEPDRGGRGNAVAVPDSGKKVEEVESLNRRIIELENIATNFCSELEHSKFYDSLTGLPNQIFFVDRVKQAIDKGIRHGLSSVVMVIDIGMHDNVNSFLGRKTSNLLLKKAAEKISGTFRAYDSVTHLTLSRFGGNEFAVLLTDISDKNSVSWIVQRILDLFVDPVEVDGSNVYLNCYIGVSVYSSAGDAEGVDELINAASIAKQNCKKSSAGNDYLFYDPFMQQESIKRTRLDSELRVAVAEKQWRLLYQPKLDISTNRIVGVEALLRWDHPQRGILTPYEFVDLAESRGFIVEIGDWVIEAACSQLVEWEGMGIHDCTIAVNLSPLQVQQSDFVEKMVGALKKYKVAPRMLSLEVTETIVMHDIHNALNSLKRLSALGMQIAVDDFGTGYSSLGYLKALPINILKIDRTFITDFCNDTKDEKIVKSLIAMAHSMELTVVAEGVEAENQFQRLRELSCDQIQGYLISKPVSPTEIEQMLKNYNSLTFQVASKSAG